MGIDSPRLHFPLARATAHALWLTLAPTSAVWVVTSVFLGTATGLRDSLSFLVGCCAAIASAPVSFAILRRHSLRRWGILVSGETVEVAREMGVDIRFATTDVRDIVEQSERVIPVGTIRRVRVTLANGRQLVLPEVAQTERLIQVLSARRAPARRER